MRKKKGVSIKCKYCGKLFYIERGQIGKRQ